MTVWRRLLQRKHLDEQLDKEVRFHLEQHADDLIAQGYAAEEAQRQARLAFGGPQQVKEECRDARGTRWLEDLWQDLRYALRALSRSPAFFAVAVTCLVLGIGINTIIFSLTMEAMFARPSIRDPQSVFYVRIGGSDITSLAVWRFLHDQGGMKEIAGADEIGEANWRLGDETHHLYAARVTGNFFDMAGVPLLFGRPIQTGDRDTAVISYGFWQRWFSGDGQILGKALVLDGQIYTITGVLPRNHRSIMGLGMSPDVYLPATKETDQVSLYARAPEGLNQAAIRSQLNPLCRELDKIKPRPPRLNRMGEDGQNQQRYGNRPYGSMGPASRSRILCCAHGSGWVSPAHCMRECCQPPAGSRLQPASRACDPNGPGRLAWSHSSTVDGGELSSGAAGSRRRVDHEFVADSSHEQDQPPRAAPYPVRDAA